MKPSNDTISQSTPSQKLWFKRKRYGWGWTPVTWQGWLVVGLYIVFMFAFGLTIDEFSPLREIIFTFLLPIVLLTSALIRICYKKGPSPKWQWGKEDNDSATF